MSQTGLIKTLAIFLILAFAHLAATAPQSAGTEQSTGKLRVAVLDTIDRIVPNIPVTIEGNNIRRTFVSEDRAYYEFDLPAGIYRITTHKGNGYYYPFRRSDFFLEAGTTALINVLPAMRITAIGTGIGEGASSVDLAPKPKYEMFHVPNSFRPETSLIIQYDCKRGRGKAIAYEARARPFNGVIVTYDVLTIIADAITVDKETLRIEATGNVIIDDGRRREHAQQKTIEFKDGKAVIWN
jgi:hypothetical protein